MSRSQRHVESIIASVEQAIDGVKRRGSLGPGQKQALMSAALLLVETVKEQPVRGRPIEDAVQSCCSLHDVSGTCIECYEVRS